MLVRDSTAGGRIQYDPQPINLPDANIDTAPFFSLSGIGNMFSIVRKASSLDCSFLKEPPMNLLRYALLTVYAVIILRWLFTSAPSFLGGLVGRFFGGGGG